ncbi:MAG TPA: L-histidine N(alpha)-methyltransferase [Bryobacteraceae bacterium]|jgi:dimethylhistidine N-methyltransferase|nr:L-histidine N(alpha)-methyltransferase [Bryobacteraceae bacterium]
MRLSDLPEIEIAAPDSELAADVRAGLAGPGQKTLPARWFYDHTGSALFEAITLLPEYGLTRADLRLLEEHSGEIARRLSGRPVRVVELGSGGGKKTRIILDSLQGDAPIDFHPIDVSQAALDACETALASLARVHPVQASYSEGLAQVVGHRRAEERLLVLFLGSNIGNFEPPRAAGLLTDVRRSLQPGDALLIGTDLVKPAARLIAAYDDAAGVTAAFNRNLLVRLNRELGASFPVRDFAHEARYDPRERRVEMHLRATRDLVAEVAALDLQVSFRAGETIWTESSYKFELAQLAGLAASTGFDSAARWVDAEWPFAESLWIAE